MDSKPFFTAPTNDSHSAGYNSTIPPIATTRMQTSHYPPTNQNSFYNVRQPHTSSTPTIQAKFPSNVVVTQSLTPQLQTKHQQQTAVLANQMSGLLPNQMSGLPPNQMSGLPVNQMSGLPPNQMSGLPANQMSGLAISSPATQMNPSSQNTTFQPPPSSQPTTFQNAPSSQPMGFQPPSQPTTFQPQTSSQLNTFQIAPPSKLNTFQPPPSSQPMGFQPPSTQQMGFQPPPSSQPTTFQNPPSSQPMGFQNAPPSQIQPNTFPPPPIQPMGFQLPPSSQPMGFQPPSSQPMGFQPPSSQPMGFQPPSSQPMGFQPPSSQPMGFQPPSSQPMGFQPPSSQPMGFQPPSSQPMGFQPPSSQPMGFQPPSSQPMGFQPPSSQPTTFQNPPSTQPMGFQPPPSSQPMGFQPSTQPMGFQPSTQQMGTNQFPAQLAAPGQQPMSGAAPIGQFGIPPITSQPKVTPDSIPSVVEIFANEKERWVSNEYLTGSRTLPPGSLISCPIRDTGNCSPRFVRSSLYTLPTSPDMIQESKLIAGVIVHPLASDPDNPKLPLVEHGPSGPIRCKRCKAYMNPFNSFTGGGASYECVFCGITNEVPSSYFQYCDSSGKRMDSGERHELSLGSYEMTVTNEYKRHQKDGSPPAIVLVLDISQRSYNNGLEGFLSSHIAGLLDRLPKDETTGESPMEVGLIAYDTQAYFFNLSVATPLVYVLTDTMDPFLPEPAGTLVPVSRAINSIKSVLERFPALFPQRKSGACLGVGAKAGLAMLSEMRRVGKLLIFQSDIPEVFGPGQLKRRSDNFFKAQTPFYEKLSAECQKSGVSVDMFLLPSAYTDVFTLGHLCHLTGGQLHYHYNFSASKPACYSRLLTELQQSLETERGFDAVMRIRASAGLSAEQFQGAIRLNGTEIQMAGVDAAQSVAVVLKYEEKLKENSLAYIQVALLYTNFRGERRLRLHNLALCTSPHFEDVYLSADLDALVQLLCRLNLRAFIEEPLAGVAERIRGQVAHILATYRRHCNPGSNRGQLILPSTMKLLPCYSNCILKLPVSPLHNSLPNAPDIRSSQYYRLQCLPTREFLLQLYPRIFPVDQKCHSISEPIRSSLERVQEERVYIATDGQQMVLWVCGSLSMQLVAELFGVSSVHQVDPSLSTLPKLDNDTSRALHQSIQSLQSWTGRSLSMVLSKQGDPSEAIFRSLLVEDGVSGRANYVDATCMLHREIKKLLS